MLLVSFLGLLRPAALVAQEQAPATGSVDPLPQVELVSANTPGHPGGSLECRRLHPAGRVEARIAELEAKEASLEQAAAASA